MMLRLIGCLLLTALAPAQVPLAELATGDQAAAEAGRRRLATSAADEVAVAPLLQLLRAGEPWRRRAAAAVLIERGLATDRVFDFLAAEADPAVVGPLYALGTGELLERLRAVGVAAPAALFAERAARGLAGPDELAAAFRAPDAEAVRRSMRIALARAPRFPVEVAADLGPRRRELLLVELVGRPRLDAEPWLAALRAEQAGVDEPVARLALLLTADPETWGAAERDAILDAMVGEEPQARHLAHEALDRLGPRMADRLIPQVHGRVLGDSGVAELLPCLDRISARGEQFLAGLSTTLERPARVAMVGFLARRDSVHVRTHLAALADDPAPLEADLIRRLGPVLDEPDRIERLVDLLDTIDPQRSEAARAAFETLCERGEWRDELLEYVRAEPTQVRSRGRTLLRLPPAQIPVAAWRALIELDGGAVAGLALPRLATAAERAELAALLEELAASDGFPGEDARRAALALAPETVARRVWERLDTVARRRLAERIARRDEGWVRPALAAEPFDLSDPQLLRARVTAGDREIVGRMLADPLAWPERAARGLEDVIPRLVDAGEAAQRLRRLVAAPPADAERGLHFLRWLAARPDLGGADELRAVWSDGDDYESRYIALRGLARRPEQRAELLARIEAQIVGGLDDDGFEIALEVLGALGFDGLDARTAGLLARLAIVEPLARVRDDLERLAADRPLAGVPVVHLFARALGASPAALAKPAVAAAVDEALAHPDVALLTRARVGRLLAAVALDAGLLEHVGPDLARLLLALPDLDRTWAGPAAWLLSQRAELDGDLERAAALAERAAVALLASPPPPIALRMFVGERHPANGSVPAARIAARPWRLRGELARAAGDLEAARRAATTARALATGDAAATTAALQLIESLQ